MTQLGSNVFSPIANYVGQVSANGYFSLSAIPGYAYTNVYGISEDVGTTLGAHQLDFGANWIHTQTECAWAIPDESPHDVHWPIERKRACGLYHRKS